MLIENFSPFSGQHCETTATGKKRTCPKTHPELLIGFPFCAVLPFQLAQKRAAALNR